MNSFELIKVRNWAIGMIITSVILLILTIIIYSTGLRGHWEFVIKGWEGSGISANFILILITFIPGIVLLTVGIALNVVCNNHLRFMQSYDERIMKMVRQLTENKNTKNTDD